jgi:hypothetical protein
VWIRSSGLDTKVGWKLMFSTFTDTRDWIHTIQEDHTVVPKTSPRMLDPLPSVGQCCVASGLGGMKAFRTNDFQLWSTFIVFCRDEPYLR